MRVLIAGIGHFREARAPEYEIAHMERVGEGYIGTETALGGFLDGVNELGIDVLYSPVARIGLERRVQREFFELLLSRIRSEMRGWKADAAYLTLDGSLAYTEGKSSCGQPELELIREIREWLGTHIPLVASFDVDPVNIRQMDDHSDALIVPDDYPGLCASELGNIAAQRVRDLLPVEVRVLTSSLGGLDVGPIQTRTGLDQRVLRLGFTDDTVPGVAVGETVAIELHLSGLSPQMVSVGIFVCDELGEVRWDVRTDFEVSSDPCMFTLRWPVQWDDPSGIYGVRAMVYSPAERWQGISSGALNVINSKDTSKSTSRLHCVPSASRDQVNGISHRFDSPDILHLEKKFREAEFLATKRCNKDGSWYVEGHTGDRRNPNKKIYNRAEGNVRGYLLGYEMYGDQRYAEEAKHGLDYLLGEQLPNGGWLPYSFTWITPQWVWLEEAEMYMTGRVAYALMEGYRVLGDPRYLEGVEKAARYVKSAPYTGNNNFDAFPLWFLSPYYAVTGDEEALDHAIARCREAVLIGQQPCGGFPAHNLSAGYQGYIVQGLTSLYEVLPENHPYRVSLRRQTLMAVNFLTWMMDSDGRFFWGWEYDRSFGVTIEGRPTGRLRVPASSPILVGLCKADRLFGVDEQVFRGVCEGLLMEDSVKDVDLLEMAVLLQWNNGISQTVRN